MSASGYKPQVDVHTVVSGAGKEYVNIRVRVGHRAVLFDPGHVDDLIDDLNGAKSVATIKKVATIEKRAREFDDE